MVLFFSRKFFKMQQDHHNQKIIALTGMMGSGKTSIGKRLAKIIDVRFIDTDFEIEKKANDSIVNIFKNKGEDYFRKLEEDTIQEIIKNNDEVIILSLGGGSLIREQTLELVKKNTLLIWIKADINTLAKRIENRKNRPLINQGNITETISNILDKRIHLYQQAHMEISSDRKISNDFLYDILKKIKNFSKE